jgi:hypothetical protein
VCRTAGPEAEARAAAPAQPALLDTVKKSCPTGSRPGRCRRVLALVDPRNGWSSGVLGPRMALAKPNEALRFVGWPGRTPGAIVRHSRGRSAAFATGQAKPAPEWILNMGVSLVCQPLAPLAFSAAFPLDRTPSAAPRDLRRRFAAPNTTRDGVSRSWLLRA